MRPDSFHARVNRPHGEISHTPIRALNARPGAMHGMPVIRSCTMRFVQRLGEWVAQEGLIPLAVTVTVTVFACGPNLRTAYESDIEWERCRTLDNDPQASREERIQCWSYWEQTYTEGQSPDRVQHARDRIARLRASTNGNPPSAGNQQQRRDDAAPPRAESPTPSPPPASSTVMNNRSGDSTPAGASDGGYPSPPSSNTVVNTPPGANCATACRDAWTTCSSNCTRNDAACIAHCDDTYRDCMRGCY